MIRSINKWPRLFTTGSNTGSPRRWLSYPESRTSWAAADIVGASAETPLCTRVPKA